MVRPTLRTAWTSNYYAYLFLQSDWMSNSTGFLPDLQPITMTFSWNLKSVGKHWNVLHTVSRICGLHPDHFMKRKYIDLFTSKIAFCIEMSTCFYQHHYFFQILESYKYPVDVYEVSNLTIQLESHLVISELCWFKQVCSFWDRWDRNMPSSPCLFFLSEQG